MGTHESGPSYLEDADGSDGVTRISVIAENPESLGDRVLEKWGCDLPFRYINVISIKGFKECAAAFGATGAALGAVPTAAFAWKYSKSPHGTALSFLGGGLFGWTFGQEVANHTMQLYKLETMAAQVKFMEWWDRKSRGRS
ncbi:unnamed protein product [Eruca vesicaria subsp. sativa]|uniref:Uncharacterized protein n=1 Tax=Eruca vesicaria subsp. sativa TaxID=29727 RepID=A0ABC8JDJ8_ERUVS|nr:unnamed protein product [Eruca vesicaria subsp. sativa]